MGKGVMKGCFGVISHAGLVARTPGDVQRRGTVIDTMWSTQRYTPGEPMIRAEIVYDVQEALFHGETSNGSSHLKATILGSNILVRDNAVCSTMTRQFAVGI